MTHFDTFSGYGGFSIALERCGIETMGFSEVDKNACAVLKYHWPNVKNYGDITTITDLPDFDVLTGGSPCQDFSIAGKREGLGGARSSLAWEFIRILRLKKPKYFIWENVKGVMSSRSGWDFANIISAFSESGYSLWWQVLNAKNFGVPQNRERIFVVGFRDGSPKEVFFKSENGQSTQKGFEQGFQQTANTIRARDYATWRGNHLQELTSGESQGYRVYDPDGIATTLAGQAGGVGAKTGLYAVPLRYLDRNQKNYQGDYSFAVDTTNTGGIMKDKQIRRLTPTECERLMGLPDDWTKYGMKLELLKDKIIVPYLSSDTSYKETVAEWRTFELSDSSRYKLCGNGVVVNCVEAITKLLI